MNSKKVYFGLLGAIGILIIGSIAALYLGNSMLKKKSATLVELKLENRVLEDQQTALVQANKDLDKYAELENITKAIVPQDKDQAKSVREIIKLASESGVQIASISFPSSSLGTAAPKPAAPAEGTTDAAAPATPAAPPVSQVTPVSGINGVYQLELTVVSDTSNPVSYVSLINFLSKLEQNRRTAQVSQISIQPFPSNPNLLTFDLVINVYIKP